MAQGSDGMNAAAIRNTCAGMCVKTMVRIRPMRAARRGDANIDAAEHRPIQNSTAPA